MSNAFAKYLRCWRLMLSISLATYRREAKNHIRRYRFSFLIAVSMFGPAILIPEIALFPWIACASQEFSLGARMLAFVVGLMLVAGWSNIHLNFVPDRRTVQSLSTACGRVWLKMSSARLLLVAWPAVLLSSVAMAVLPLRLSLFVILAMYAQLLFVVTVSTAIDRYSSCGERRLIFLRGAAGAFFLQIARDFKSISMPMLVRLIVAAGYAWIVLFIATQLATDSRPVFIFFALLPVSFIGFGLVGHVADHRIRAALIMATASLLALLDALYEALIALLMALVGGLVVAFGFESLDTSSVGKELAFASLGAGTALTALYHTGSRLLSRSVFMYGRSTKR